jgi:hypothetical protein
VDRKVWTLLEADLAAQQATVDRVFTLLMQRSEGLASENLEQLESAAYQLHNLYGAVEGLLKVVAAYFENNISDSSRWHSLLLQRMTQPVQGVRPAVLSPQNYEALNALRAFRHFFRHAYGVPIDFAQLQSNLEKAKLMYPQLAKDLISFLNEIRATLSNDEMHR